MKRNLLLLFILTTCIFLSCKKNINSSESLNTEAKKLLSDYNEFVDTLKKYHPALYEFIPENEFEKRVQELKKEINNTTTQKEFIWKLSEVIALVGCGHTSLGFFNQQRDRLKINEYFPLLTRLINDKLYVIDNLTNSDKIEKGDEIIEINGQSVSDILSTIYSHITSQAHIITPKKMLFNGYNTSLIPYAINFPEVYTVKTKNSSKLITLNSLNEKPPYAPIFSKKHPCQKDFCLTEINTNTALLTLRNFAYYGKKTKIITNFLNDSFKEIKQKKYQNIIIDVRGNLGGSGEVSIHLLKHTLQEPFYYFRKSDYGRKELQQPFKNNFDGNIFFLMNGEGFSTVGHLASIYKDKNRVTFVGETLGSNQFCTANQKQFKLTNTKITYTVARNIFATAVKEENSKATIKPDVKVEQSIEDFFADKDVILARTLEFITKNQTLTKK